MFQYIARQLRHWSESKTRTTMLDRVVYFAPVLTVAALTTLGVWGVAKIDARLAQSKGT